MKVVLNRGNKKELKGRTCREDLPECVSKNNKAAKRGEKTKEKPWRPFQKKMGRSLEIRPANSRAA